jgi:quinolinate synthase
MILWNGTCIVHDQFSVRELVKLKTANPDALVTAHPECPESILDHADHVGSTRGILNFVLNTQANKFIVATERHIIHQMEKAAPEKTFIAAPGADGECSCSSCPYMELNTLEKIYLAMKNEAPRIEIQKDLRIRAHKPLEKMLEMSPSAGAITQAAE